MKNQAFNFITLVKYSGRNAGLKGNGKINAFATFNQVRESGYSVNKGAKSISIFTGYYTRDEKNKDGVIESVTVPTHARVFDIKDTSAYKDEEFMKWLQNDAVIVDSERVTGHKILTASLA